MPLEILESVFELVRGEDYDRSPCWGERQQPCLVHRSLSWIAFSHVCQYWRECARGFKRLWRLIQIDNITESDCERALAIATTFLERSKPLRVIFHHETTQVPTPAVTRLLDNFYANLAENRERISGFLLWGTFHQTAWMLVQEGLPKAAEIGLHVYPGEQPRIYGGSPEVELCVERPTFNVKKLSLSDYRCTSNSYPNVTHLQYHQPFRDEDQKWILRFISSLSNSLQVLCLQIAGLHPSFPPEPGEDIHLPHLTQVVAIPLEYGSSWDGDGRLDYLRHLSLPPSVPILWSTTRSQIYELAYFPPTEYRELVQNIVVSLHPPDYLNCLIEGTTLFTSLGNINDLSTLHELCIRFFNVTSISLPSSWLTTRFTELIFELDDFQVQTIRFRAFCSDLAELHVYTGNSDGVVLDAWMHETISWKLIKSRFPPLELSTDHSMQFYRKILGKSFPLYFHPGELPLHYVEQYW